MKHSYNSLVLAIGLFLLVAAMVRAQDAPQQQQALPQQQQGSQQQGQQQQQGTPQQQQQGLPQQQTPNSLEPNRPPVSVDVLEQLKQEIEMKKQQTTGSASGNALEGAQDQDAVSNVRQIANPYSDIPALSDLYKQVSNQSKVTRFGAAIFLNGPGSTNDNNAYTCTTVGNPSMGGGVVNPTMPAGIGNATTGTGSGNPNARSGIGNAMTGPGSLMMRTGIGNGVTGNVPGGAETDQATSGPGSDNTRTGIGLGNSTTCTPVTNSTAGNGFGPGNAEQLPMDLPVGPDYVVGPGDSLRLDVWGSVSDEGERMVDRQGQLTLPEVGSLQAAGQTLGSLQHSVEALLNTRFRNVHAAVSLAKLRSIRVYIVGDVVRPGAYDISSMSTVLNALYAAGGPTAGGSLRVARHYRGQQVIQEVDLYDLILHGVRHDMQRLQAGDTVMVPTVGAEVTVQGMVRRPAIYELRGERSLAEVLAMAGGLLPTGTLRHVDVERVQANEKRTMLSLDLPEKADNSAANRLVQEFQVQDQDNIRISPILPYSDKTVFLTGHVVRPGRYSYTDGMKVTDVIKSAADLLPEPAHYAEIIRLLPPDFHPTVIGFNVSPGSAMPDAMPLQAFDTLRFYSKYDFQDGPVVTVAGEVRDPGAHKLNGDSRVRDAVFAAGGLTGDALLAWAQIYRRQAASVTKVFTIDLGKAMAGDADANIALGASDMLVIHSNPAKVDPMRVYIQGSVARPGAYPLSAGMKTSDLVRMAGGFRRGAYTESADLARYQVLNGSTVRTPEETIAIGKAVDGDLSADVELREGDVLAIRQITGWEDIGASVTVKGEVAHAGGFGIQEGERLSSVLKRAGGFRTDAYARGIVVEREEVRLIAEKTRAELIDRIESQQMNAVQVDSDSSTKESVTQDLQLMKMQRDEILDRLKKQVVSGRIALRIGDDIARWEGTQADIELRAGDVITVPKRPSFVVVSGEVYGPTAITYAPNRTVSWYVERAGGSTDTANKKHVFVICADGSVIGRKSGMSLGSSDVSSYRPKPGDAIVVPEKIAGSNKAWQHVAETAQILTSIALMASVAVR